MSEERFFESIKSTMSDYRPEVPQSVYTGMRKKLWWSQFTMWNASRFNMWYVLILLGLGGAAYPLVQGENTPQAQVETTPSMENTVSTTAPIQNSNDGNFVSDAVPTNAFHSHQSKSQPVRSVSYSSAEATTIDNNIANTGVVATPNESDLGKMEQPNGSEQTISSQVATEFMAPEKKVERRTKKLTVPIYNGDPKKNK